jgi:hypothetical protein
MSSADFVPLLLLTASMRTHYQGQEDMGEEREPITSIVDGLSAMYEGTAGLPRGGIIGEIKAPGVTVGPPRRVRASPRR